MTDPIHIGARVKYIGRNERNIGATGTIIARDNNGQFRVKFDQPLTDDSGFTTCPFTQQPYLEATCFASAVQPLSE
tara:strand:- start:176 stop:403 length:228 start_codon:yes stop_codon:yes gene_type:complete